MKIVLIGGYPKGFDEPFHIKTRSGRVLRKITEEAGIEPIFFDLWKNQEEEDARILAEDTVSALNRFAKENYKLIALGRYIEEALVKTGFKCEYLPHPASRDKKFLLRLKNGLEKYK